MIPLFERARQAGDRRAIIAPEGTFSYRQLLELSAGVAGRLLDGADDLRGGRVAFLIPSGIHYVATQWGVWRAGGIAVPLCMHHPAPELEYVLTDSQASIVVAHPQFATRLRPLAEKLGLRFLLTGETGQGNLPELTLDRRAMLVYTSGTTSKPKAVVTTHANLEAQIASLVTAWEWTANDHILHVLPLHHVHGIVNVLLCALSVGATCEMLPEFDAEKVWDRLASRELTLFMAVPTIYTRLAAKPRAGDYSHIRLMVCGSAALPVSTLERWRELTGHTLLERYGMTETGMILSNPLHGERRPGYVGTPLPGIEVKLVGEPAEIWVRGPGVFREYWNRPEATAKAFCDGWFLTGDVAVFENGMYRMLGRSSIDIIKTGGYKVSALEIEETLREHPAIKECAVVGVPDSEWGERVCVAIVGNLQLDELREWAKQRLATYKVPSRLAVMESLPRNAMGKVVKPELVKLKW
ncbi:MAG: Long-chain-fatty-acid--CoA ligase [Verrucomicrobiae bacterium]|nr:Long-chain-fatty-acid--CoA ligase [Verrucomicrobiae bacterium]